RCFVPRRSCSTTRTSPVNEIPAENSGIQFSNKRCLRRTGVDEFYHSARGEIAQAPGRGGRAFGHFRRFTSLRRSFPNPVEMTASPPECPPPPKREAASD